MRVVGFDTETALIRPALLAPPLVCLTWQAEGEAPRIEHHAGQAFNWLTAWLLNPEVLLVGHNVAYDMAVIGARFPALIPLIFAAYDADRVTDTMIRQQLLDVAAGVYRGRPGEKGRWIKHDYTLEALAKRNANIVLRKDGFRLHYDKFLETPLDGWVERARVLKAEGVVGADVEPEEVVRYPLEDARATLAVYQAQQKHASYLDDQYRQAHAAFALHLSSAWGLRTDAAGVERLRTETAATLASLEFELREAGLVREDGTRDTKAAAAKMLAVCRERKLPIRRTDGHAACAVGDAADCHVCLDADACNATEDETLMAYAEMSTAKKVLTNDVEALAKGGYYPVHTRYGFAETGRTTSSNPNIQNIRRLPGIREAFVPRPGRVFAQADYPQLELYTLAQCCVTWLGRSKLADALNAGLDPHMRMAAQILGIPYDEAKANVEREDVDNARQTAKVANFGFPGGLGIQKLILFARKTYNVALTIDSAKRLKEQWYAAWPEMPHYFSRINALCDNDSGRAVVESLWTKRTRGNASYCAACNNGFQALGADCAKRAAWLIAKAQYTNPDSVLWNTRTVAFVHDEFILEVDDDEHAHDAAHMLARLMVQGANTYLPDVPISFAKMSPLLMRRWSKKAKPRLDAEGRLVPWGDP